MAHYLELHSVAKEFTKGVKVLSFTEFKEPLKTLFKTPRTFMNDTVRAHFSAKSDDWDADYFVLYDSSAYYLIKELEKLTGEPDIDQEEIELLGQVLAVLEDINKDIDSETTGYLISWCK